MTVDWRTSDRLESFQLSRGSNVVPHNLYVDQTQGNDKKPEDGSRNHDDQKGRKDLHNALGRQLDVQWKEEVDRLDILSNSVQNPSERCRVVEGHWSSEESMKKRSMEISGGTDSSKEKRQHSNEEKNYFSEAESGVDSQTHSDILLGLGGV